MAKRKLCNIAENIKIKRTRARGVYLLAVDRRHAHEEDRRFNGINVAIQPTC